MSWTGEDVESKPKHSMVAILSVLFVVAYCMMTMLIVEQARTIDTQRNLIHVLFDDSVQLSALKGKAAQKKECTNSPAAAKNQAQAPSTQAKTQDSQAQTPSSQVPPRAGAKNEQKAGKIRKPAPLKPPKDTSDEADERRTLVTI